VPVRRGRARVRPPLAPGPSAPGADEPLRRSNEGFERRMNCR